MNTSKKILIFMFIATGLFLTFGLIIGLYFFNLALNPNYDKSSILEAPHNQISVDDDAIAQGSDVTISNESWLTSIGYNNFYIKSDDNLRLHAYKITQANHSKWAILCHGYTSNGRQMSSAGKHFYDMGFNLLLPDARGHGLSEGSYIGMGWHERKDIVKWIDTILADNPNDEIILYGISMGAATVMMTAGEDLPANVKAIIEDCGYTSVKEEFSYQLKETFGIPAFPIIQFASFVTYLKAGYTLTEANAVKQVQQSQTPMLFIHGDEDTFVPPYMVDIVYEAANVEKEKFIVEGAGHGLAARVAGELYWETIETFLDNYVKK